MMERTTTATNFGGSDFWLIRSRWLGKREERIAVVDPIREKRGMMMPFRTKTTTAAANVLLLFLLLVFFGLHGDADEYGGVVAARSTPPASTISAAAAGTARVLRGAQAVEIGLGSSLVDEVKGVRWQEKEAPDGAVTAMLIPDPSGDGSYFGFYGFYGFYGMDSVAGALLGGGLDGSLGEESSSLPPPSGGTGSGAPPGGTGGDGGGSGSGNPLGLADNATCGERLIAVVNSTNVTGILKEPRTYLNCTCVDTLYRAAFGGTTTLACIVNATKTGDGNTTAAGAASCNQINGSGVNAATLPPPPPPPPPPPLLPPPVNVTALNGTSSTVNGTNGSANGVNVTASLPSPAPPPPYPPPLAKLVMCSVLFSGASPAHPPPPPRPPPAPPLTPSNTTSPEAVAWQNAAVEAVKAAAANETKEVIIPLLASREKVILHAPWIPAGVNVLNTSLDRVDIEGLLSAENTRRRASVLAAAAATPPPPPTNMTNSTGGLNATAFTPPPVSAPPPPPIYTVLPHPLPDMAAAGLWPLRYPAMTVPGAGGKPVCMLDPPTAAGLMPKPDSGGFLMQEAFGEYVYKVLLPEILYNRSDGVVNRGNWSLDNVTGLFGDCIGDPPGPPPPPKKDPLQWLYDDPILGALIGTSLPGIIAGVMKKIKDSQAKLIKAKKLALEKLKELKLKEVKWRNKVQYKAVQTRREKKRMEGEFAARMNGFYTYVPSPKELKPFNGDKVAFRKAKQQEIKDERTDVFDALDKEFEDYEDMYEAREKERLNEIIAILGEAMPKTLAQTFVDNVKMLPPEVLDQMQQAGGSLMASMNKKKDNKVAPEPGNEEGKGSVAEGKDAFKADAVGQEDEEVAVVSTNPKVVNFKRKKGVQLPPLPGLPAPLAVEPGADTKVDNK